MNNDFHKTHDIFDLFKGLTVKDLDVEVPADEGATSESQPDGVQPDAPKDNNPQPATSD